MAHKPHTDHLRSDFAQQDGAPQYMLYFAPGVMRQLGPVMHGNAPGSPGSLLGMLC